MNELIVKDNLKIEDLIHEVRGKQVMLDSDLAKLYGVLKQKELMKLLKEIMKNFRKDFHGF